MQWTLKMLRVRNNWTQEEAGKAVGVSEKTWSNWENFKTFPDVPKVKRIESVFGVTYDDIKFLQENTV